MRTPSLLIATCLGTSALAQSTTTAGAPQLPLAQRAVFVSDGHTRIADPKLAGGGVAVAFHSQSPGASVPAVVEAVRGGTVVATLWSGLAAPQAPVQIAWDGKAGDGTWLDTGSYSIRVRATTPGIASLSLPLDVVRLGITEIEAQDSAGDDEWQMVYFRKGTTYAFYATPAIHEYVSIAGAGEVSDLDGNNGDPRPPVAVHTGTASPVLDGTAYETDAYNYPLAYQVGATPRFQVTFGATATGIGGQAIGAGYPVSGIEIRCTASDAIGAWTSSSGAIQPGGTAVFVGPALRTDAGRSERDVAWRWQYRTSAPRGPWIDVPGSLTTHHRFYAQLGKPIFAAGATGTQYSGPWVEVAEFFETWKQALAFPTGAETGVVHTTFRGFFGQTGSLATAIEGIVYDAYPLGGDGGANHYFNASTKTIDMSRLLNAHANGKYVNCSDVASATSAIAAMLGVTNVKMVRLGPMTLKAIWGIGSPAYTTSLWGGGSHSFSYHHVVTRDAAASICDACMWLDEDGTPTMTPGLPGYNCDRPWAGAGGYNDLSAYNPVTKTVETLPKIQ